MEELLIYTLCGLVGVTVFSLGILLGVGISR